MAPENNAFVFPMEKLGTERGLDIQITVRGGDALQLLGFSSFLSIFSAQSAQNIELILNLNGSFMMSETLR